MNIAAALTEQARSRPDAAALVLVDGRRVTYRELDEDAGRIARGLGLAPGTRTVLMVPPGPDFYPLMFGLFRAGAVPVVVDPGMGLRRMKASLAEARPEAFVGILKAHVARVFLGLGGPTVKAKFGVGPCLGLGGVSLDEVRRRGGGGLAAVERSPGDPAAILFTSGSTGPPRGAVYTHGNLAAQVEMVRRTFGIEPGEIDLPTFPLFALFDPALGMTTVVPDMDPARPALARPGRIARAIESQRVTTMFASPGLLEPLAAWCTWTGVRFTSLRRVISAGAPVSPRVVEEMARALPEGGRIHTPYGATEALPVASIDHGTILGETRAMTAAGAGVCVGLPVAGVEVRVIRISDVAIPSWSGDLAVPAGETGEICVKGAQVSGGYFGRPDADALAKIPDPAGGFWHRMGDVGYLDGRGRLCGRKSQRVRTPEGDLVPDQCEAVFNVHRLVRRSALAGGREPVLWIEFAEAGDLHLDEDAVRAELAALGAGAPCTRGIREFRFVEGRLPVDTRHNAKIQRERLR
jgi:acyl-CoA synthetase (AMP-forming)/AMP-acid ligase II